MKSTLKIDSDEVVQDLVFNHFSHFIIFWNRTGIRKFFNRNSEKY